MNGTKEGERYNVTVQKIILTSTYVMQIIVFEQNNLYIIVKK